MKRMLLAVLLLALLAPVQGWGRSPQMKGVQRIVFLGDSLTDCAAWVDFVGETLKANGYPDVLVYNAGIGGDVIGNMRARLAKDVLELAPDLVVIFAGTNDAGNPEGFARDLDAIVSTLRAKKVKVMLLTVPDIANGQPRPFNVRLATINQTITTTAQQYGCLVSDVRAAFSAAVQAGKTVQGRDGVHHEIDGWRTVARNVLDTLGCPAPLVEKAAPYPGTVLEWMIGPPVKHDPQAPPHPDFSPTFDPLQAGWTRFEAAKERQSAAWWIAYAFDRGGIFPLGEPRRTPDSGALAMAILFATDEVKTTLRIGGGAPVILWVNGEQLYEAKPSRGTHPDTERFPVTLHAGENRIFVYSGWVFHLSLDVLAQKKAPVKVMTFMAEPPPLPF